MNLVSPTSANKRKQQEASTPNPKLSPPMPSSAASLTAVSPVLSASSPTDSDGLGKKAKVSAAGQLISSPFKVPQSRPPAHQPVPAPLTLEVPGLSRSSSSPSLNTVSPAFHSPTAANTKRKKQHKRMASGSYYPTPASPANTSSMSNPYSPPPPTTAPTSPTPSTVASHNSSTSSLSSNQSSPRHTTTNPTTTTTNNTTNNGSSDSSSLSTNTYLQAGQLEIFERVNEIMKRDHIRQRQIAKMMNISCSTLSPMLKGKYKHTKLKHVEQLRNWCYQRDVKLWRKVAYYADAASLNEETLASTCGMNVMYFKQWLTFTLPLKYRLPFDQTLSEWVQSLASDVSPYEEKNDRLGEAGKSGSEKEDNGTVETSRAKFKRKNKKSPQNAAAPTAATAAADKDGGEDKETQPEKKERVKKEPKVEEDDSPDTADDAEADQEDDMQPPVEDAEFSVAADSTFGRLGVPAPGLPATMSEAMGEESALQFVPLELARMQGMNQVMEAAMAASNAPSVLNYARLPTELSEQERVFKAQQDLIASQRQQLEILTRLCSEKNSAAAAVVAQQQHQQLQQQQQQQQQQQRQFALQHSLQQQAAMMDERDRLSSPRSAPPAVSSPTHSTASLFASNSHRLSPSSATSALAAAQSRRAQVAHAVAVFAQSRAEAQVKAMLGLDNFTEEDEEVLKEIQDAQMQAAKQHVATGLDITHTTPMRAGVAAGVFFTPDNHHAALHQYASPATSSQPPPLTPASDASSVYSTSTTPVSRRHASMAPTQPAAFTFMTRVNGKQSGMYGAEESSHNMSSSADLSASFTSALGQQHWSDGSMHMLASPALSSSSSHSLSPMPVGHHDGAGEQSMASFLLSKLPSASASHSTSPAPSNHASTGSPSASQASDMHVSDFFADEWNDAVHEHSHHGHHHQQQQQHRGGGGGGMDEYGGMEDELMGYAPAQRLQLLEHTNPSTTTRSRMY